MKRIADLDPTREDHGLFIDAQERWWIGSDDALRVDIAAGLTLECGFDDDFGDIDECFLVQGWDDLDEVWTITLKPSAARILQAHVPLELKVKGDEDAALVAVIRGGKP